MENKMKECTVKCNKKETTDVSCEAEWNAAFTDDDVSISKIKNNLVQFYTGLIYVRLVFT